ncbi:MAG: Gx transporter family protein, partial [Clostridia bacterium]|nr:Gx transporter family protein [Clostridia bacterium]
MNRGMTQTKRLAADALLLTTAFILSWIEMIISLPVAVPGIKIGLANLAILFTMYYCGNT